MIPKILQDVKNKGYRTFVNGSYNLNIIGVRSSSNISNKFDDEIHVVFKQDDKWVDLVFPITTDPGLYWLENPTRVEGTAILCAGQYRSAYKLGLHRNSYEALVQTGGTVKVYRDRNKDQVLDRAKDTIHSGFFGINIHRSSKSGESSAVNKWSAGCQVFKNVYDYNIFIALCKKSAEIYGNGFTYTLLEK